MFRGGTVGLFDLRPKTRREDLFDRERELELLHRGVERGYPVIVVFGVRRVGKTSLLRVFLNEVVGLYVDMRGVFRRGDLEVKLTEAFESSLSRLRRFLEGVRGVEISGLSVQVRWRGRDSLSLLGLLTEINKRRERFVIVLDEAQSTRPPLSYELKNAVAYSYDNLENITFIIAGSEIGLLRDFMGYENPSSPLYGRGVYEVVVERFTPQSSREFLERGFREEGVEPPTNLIEEAVAFLDGIPGWLAYFGRRYVDGEKDFNTIKNAAVAIALDELSKLSVREKLVLKALANNAKSWSQIRDYILEKHGLALPKSTLSRHINKLEKLGIIRNYEFLDQVYKEAANRLIIKTT
jgi:AAA+ ATPase superfamily predicted ATPase